MHTPPHIQREMTAESIRDKIAASKARGMWMGGVPLLDTDPMAAAGSVKASDGALTVGMSKPAATRLGISTPPPR